MRDLFGQSGQRGSYIDKATLDSRLVRSELRWRQCMYLPQLHRYHTLRPIKGFYLIPQELL